MIIFKYRVLIKHPHNRYLFSTDTFFGPIKYMININCWSYSMGKASEWNDASGLSPE